GVGGGGWGGGGGGVGGGGWGVVGVCVWCFFFFYGRRAAVVLQAERLENRRRVLPADVLEMERVAVDHLPVAEWEDLHDRAVPLGRKADDVDGADRTAICGLALGEVLHRAQTVSVAPRVLESLLGRGLAHLPLQLALDRLRVAR